MYSLLSKLTNETIELNREKRTRKEGIVSYSMFRPFAAIYHKFWPEESSHIASTLFVGCIHAVEKHELGGCGPNRPKLKLSLFLGFSIFAMLRPLLGM